MRFPRKIPETVVPPKLLIFARNLEPDDLGLVSPTNRKILFHSSHGTPGISNRNIWSNGKRPSLKALGNIAVRRRHESNVVIYEISQATFSAKTILDKTVKFW